MTSFKQKLSAFLVLSLFILSVLPAGLADEGQSVVDVEVDAEVKTESKTEVETEENDSETEEEVEVKTDEKD